MVGDSESTNGTTGGETTGGDTQGTGPDGPPDVTCDRTSELVPGMNYGDYSLFALRVDAELDNGSYSVRVNDGTTGIAYVFVDDVFLDEFEYDPFVSLEDGELGTIAFRGLFELDLRSQEQVDLTGLGDSVFDGCHLVVVEDAAPIVEGGIYGSILVESVDVDASAQAGVYTFYTHPGDAGSVELRRDGKLVDTLAYDWTTTIGNGDSFTFVFPGVVSLTVTRPMGTSNLFSMATHLFDGQHELTVPAR